MKIETIATILLYAALTVSGFYLLDFGFDLLTAKSGIENLGGLFVLILTLIGLLGSVNYLTKDKKPTK